MAFQRLCDTRGRPTNMYSDNALNFRSAENQLLQHVEIANKDIPNEIDHYHFEWHYSTNLAPHTGGVWERMVKAVKHPLNKAIRTAALTYTELYTALKDVEAMVNDRPLIAAAADTMEVLTPSMLMLGRKLRPWVVRYDLPRHPLDKTLKERWEHRIAIGNAFWKLWAQQYLLEAQSRGKWFTKTPNLKVGDLVLLEIDKKKRNTWPIAKVHSIEKGRDGLVRTVEVRLGERKDPQGNEIEPYHLVRSIRSVFPLEQNLEELNND